MKYDLRATIGEIAEPQVAPLLFRRLSGDALRAVGGLIGLTALMTLMAQQAFAQYSVSLQVDATSGAESYQTNIDPELATSISASQLANSTTGGPPSGSGSASAGATAAIGSLSASAGATADGAGGGDAISETAFMDTLTLTAGSYQIGFLPAGGVSVNGGMNTSGTAFTTLSFSASPAGATGGNVNFTQDVCMEVINGSPISCGGGWQSAPSSLSTTINVTAAGFYQISGSFVSEALVEGGAVPYTCGIDVCYNLYSITADAGDPAQFYVNPLSPGASVISASGASYAEPSPVPIPAACWLMLSGLGGLALMGRRRITPQS
jgi:hypothetical protein